jgi:hypothetical protein
VAPFSSPTPRRRVLLLLSYHLTATERGIMKYAREADWTLDLRALRTGFLPEPGGIDGILCLLGGWESRPEMTEFVRRAGVPVVDMHGDEIGKVPAGRVLADNLRIGELAAGHFATRGFTNCLFCCRSLSDWSARQRQRSFGATLDQLGIRNRIFEHRAMTRHGIPVGIPVGDVVAGLVHELASVETRSASSRKTTTSPRSCSMPAGSSASGSPNRPRCSASATTRWWWTSLRCPCRASIPTWADGPTAPRNSSRG